MARVRPLLQQLHRLRPGAAAAESGAAMRDLSPPDATDARVGLAVDLAARRQPGVRGARWSRSPRADLHDAAIELARLAPAGSILRSVSRTCSNSCGSSSVKSMAIGISITARIAPYAAGDTGCARAPTELRSSGVETTTHADDRAAPMVTTGAGRSAIASRSPRLQQRIDANVRGSIGDGTCGSGAAPGRGSAMEQDMQRTTTRRRS